MSRLCWFLFGFAVSGIVDYVMERRPTFRRDTVDIDAALAPYEPCPPFGLYVCMHQRGHDGAHEDAAGNLWTWTDWFADAVAAQPPRVVADEAWLDRGP